jgi:hypothetical protein
MVFILCVISFFKMFFLSLIDKFGNPCSKFGPPFINNCGYDAAGNMLNFLYNNTLTGRTNASSPVFSSSFRFKVLIFSCFCFGILK